MQCPTSKKQQLQNLVRYSMSYQIHGSVCNLVRHIPLWKKKWSSIRNIGPRYPPLVQKRVLVGRN